MKERIFKLRKIIIESLRNIDEDVKISLKSLNSKFDDDVIQSILFDSGKIEKVKEKDYYYELIRDFLRPNKDDENIDKENDEIIEMYKKDPFDFFYYKLDEIIKKRGLDKKSSDLYFKFRTLYINEEGLKSNYKTFALPDDVLKKIDFSEVSFDNFYISDKSIESSGAFIKKYNDFSEFYGVKINPQKLYRDSLLYCKFRGVEFTAPFEGADFMYADFTGSKNAIIDLEKYRLCRLENCVFNSVTFSNEFGTKSCKNIHMVNVDFSGSQNAIIDMGCVNVMSDCNLQDAVLKGLFSNKRKLYNIWITGTSFKGARVKNKLLPFFEKYITIYLGNFVTDFQNVDFAGCNLIGVIDYGNICGTNFEGSTGAIIKLGRVKYDASTNFSDTTVYNESGKIMEVTIDGRINDPLSNKINEIFNLPDSRLVDLKNKEEEINQYLIDKREESIQKILVELEALRKVEELSRGTINDVYGRIMIDRDKILVRIGDHYEFNRYFIPYFRFLSFHKIDFTNVKVAGLDFRKTFAIIDPQTVYEKDLSNCIFDIKNFSVSSDFTGVNVDGANFDECSDLFHQFHKGL